MYKQTVESLMTTLITGQLNKMVSLLDSSNNVSYFLPSSGKDVSLNEKEAEENISLNTLIGSEITLKHTGEIFCIGCGSETEKTYNQGYCKTCHETLARCDSCSIKPEKCHYHENTCREPSWGEANCLTPHIVYLSYTSGYKVGITRQQNIPHRWIDQGAGLAIPMFRVDERLLSGLVEEVFKEFVADKTNWRTMLMSDEIPTHEEMQAKANELCELAKSQVEMIQLKFGKNTIERLNHEKPQELHYPLPTKRPFEKVGMPHNLDKKPELSGVFHGIKGQYLYVGSTVINLRKYAGYMVEISTK